MTKTRSSLSWEYVTKFPLLNFKKTITECQKVGLLQNWEPSKNNCTIRLTRKTFLMEKGNSINGPQIVSFFILWLKWQVRGTYTIFQSLSTSMICLGCLTGTIHLSYLTKWSLKCSPHIFPWKPYRRNPRGKSGMWHHNVYASNTTKQQIMQRRSWGKIFFKWFLRVIEENIER